MVLPHAQRPNPIAYSMESLKKQVALLQEQVDLMDNAILAGFSHFAETNKGLAPNLYELRREAFERILGISPSQKYKLFNYFVITAKKGQHKDFKLDEENVFVIKK